MNMQYFQSTIDPNVKHSLLVLTLSCFPSEGNSTSIFLMLKVQVRIPKIPIVPCVCPKGFPQIIFSEVSLVVIKLPYVWSTMLCSKLSKGMGHNCYGEPGWPNDILYIFPIVIFGIRSWILGLAIREPLSIGTKADPFATPFLILPEWYLFPTFNLLRILCEKFMGILSILVLPGVLLVIPFGENLSTYQNPYRRPRILSIFLYAVIYSIWLGISL